jgi:thermostable 8-oxoguanine DNA glycosylase
MSIEVKVRNLICYIESLSGFQLVKPEIPIPYGHMGATITDAMLQAGTTWETVVKPRVKNILKYSEATKTTGFYKLLNKEGANKLLNWEDQEKPRRIMEVINFFIKEEIETEEDLKNWIGKDNNILRLKELRGIGNKTVDYFKILSGISTPAVDRHLIGFLKGAGIDTDSYFEAREIISKTAEEIEIESSLLDHSIWKYMSEGKRKKSRKIECKNQEMESNELRKIKAHHGKTEMRHTFQETWDYLDNNGPVNLQTSREVRFQARASVTESGKDVIIFQQGGKEYARAYECCWGHYYNCNRTRFGMYAKALDHNLVKI